MDSVLWHEKLLVPGFYKTMLSVRSVRDRVQQQDLIWDKKREKKN